MAAHFLQLLLLFISLPFPLLSSALSASRALRLHGGYSLSASSLSLSLSSPSWNRSGTLLAPPDSAFSLPLRPPSLSLLLSHTLRARLASRDLSSLSPPHRPLATWHPHRCLAIPAVNILHPDIYVDDRLAVHGIDRLVTDDLTVRCSAETKSHFLDHAMRVLRRKGFGVVAAALTAKKSDLLKLDDVTVFATSDEILFSEVDGFRYDFLRHVAPRRYRLEEIQRLTAIETLEPERTIAVGSEADGYFEIYHNRWIVVIGISRSFDDEDLSPTAMSGGGVYGEEDMAEEWRRSPPPERLCTAEDYLFCPARERRSEALVAEKMVESAPSHEINKEGESEPLDGRVLGESTVEMARRRMSSLSGVGRNSEGPKIVQFQVADDLFYYT